MPTSTEKFPYSPEGDRAYRDVCGEEFMDKLRASITSLDAERAIFTNDHVYGRTWARGVLSKQQLSLITMGLLAGANHWDEFELHFRNAVLHTKVPHDQLREFLFHINLYCGVPSGRNALFRAKAVLAELGIDPDSFVE